MVMQIRERLKKFWAALALLSVEILVVALLFFTALALFVYFARRIFYVRNEKLDFKVFDFLSHHVTETNNNIMLAITFLGRHEFLIPANLALIAYFLFIKKHKWYSIKIPAIALSSVALMFVLKNLFNRPRPLIPLLEEARGLSFPSGHALMSVTFYGLLIYIIWHSVKNPVARWILIGFFCILIFMIGFSRIYLRVHYTSDVIAGFSMGFLWLVISLWVVRRMEKFSKRTVDPVVQESIDNPAAD